jgi:hypothetical protein
VIFVRFEQVGFHCWPDAPSHRAYLRASHRHLFGIEVTTHVDHDERDIEFHDLRDEAAALFRGLSICKQDFGPQSCETLARRLATQLADRYARTVTVIVSEDGECGASVEVGPEIEA